MADLFDKTIRSSIMQKVRSLGNKSTELWLIALFRDNGITGWRRNYNVQSKKRDVIIEIMPLFLLFRIGLEMIQ